MLENTEIFSLEFLADLNIKYLILRLILYYYNNIKMIIIKINTTQKNNDKINRKLNILY